MEDNCILVFGGIDDYEIKYFREEIKRKTNIKIITVILEDNISPKLEWDYEKDKLILDNNEIKITHIWIRYDVFQSKITLQKRARRFDLIIKGWIKAHPEIKIINREWIDRINSKPYQLYVAQQVGLKIPKTIITNDYKIMKQYKDYIIKPVDNGYCESLDDILEKTRKEEIKKEDIFACPAFIQEKLENPEYRIYYIYGEYVIFKMSSKSEELDNRKVKNIIIEKIDNIDEEILTKIKYLCEKLELDYGAIDMKTRGEEIIFLEINNFPMLARYDMESKGEIINKIINKYIEN
jgi:glutathione synthase/RimK-type ligase-like ATP-grasp enzyme